MAHSIPVPSVDLLNSAIEAHYEEIKAAVRRRGHSHDSAADIVHDLYLKLADHPDSLAGARSVRAFLLRAAANLGIDRMRRASFETRLFSGSEAEAEQLAAATPAPDHTLEISARLHALRQAILELPRRQRSVFVLHRLQQMPPDAIAAKLGISRVTVDRHLRAAMLHCLDRLSQID